MGYSVYILQCVDGSYYVGSAEDVDERVRRHNAGEGADWTARRRPVTLLYTECHNDKSAAIQREQQIKHWNRAKKEALIADNKERLRKLSKSRT